MASSTSIGNKRGMNSKRQRNQQHEQQRQLQSTIKFSVYNYLFVLFWCCISLLDIFYRHNVEYGVNSFIIVQQSSARCSNRPSRDLFPHVVTTTCLGSRDKQQHTFGLLAKKVGNKSNKIDDDDDDVDIPEDWSEDDVLAEFADVDVVDDIEVEEEEDDEIVAEEDAALITVDTVAAGNDDEDDEIDVEDIDLDEEEEEDDDSIVEEMAVGTRIPVYVEDGWDETQQQLQQYGYDDPRIGDVYVPWDPVEDEIEYELQEDTSDPNYMEQLQAVQEAVLESQKYIAEQNFDAYEYLYQQDDGVSPLTPEQMTALDQLDIVKLAQERSQNVELTEMDISDIDIEREYNTTSDLMIDDPYPRHDKDEYNFLEANTGVTDDDMEELDSTYKGINELTTMEPWDKVMLASLRGLDHLDNETLAEMEDCLEEIGGSAYNVTNWLLYDLEFNVSNLILAAVKHNPNAPILFQHWYPQLATYSRYEHARQRDFDFTWTDVENADISELERYYNGFGYTSIPTKNPAETGIIQLDELDEEEIKMAAFESWMTEVYNPEGDRKDFDDDTMRDEDNVFSDYYEAPQHPDLPTFDDAVDDIDTWRRDDLGLDEQQDPSMLLPGNIKTATPEAESTNEATSYDDVTTYTNMMGRTFSYKVVQDDEFVRDFRGHLIIACTGMDSDLAVAEKITKRFEREFGKAVFVETRVLAVAREEDNVYEIWLESYDIDLLHSKKRATSGAKGWDGPAEINDEHIEYLTNKVKFLISDDARYSYRYELEFAG